MKSVENTNLGREGIEQSDFDGYLWCLRSDIGFDDGRDDPKFGVDTG